MDIQIGEFKKCAELVKIIMHNAEKLEGLVLEEQLGFRDFAGWVRYGALTIILFQGRMHIRQRLTQFGGLCRTRAPVGY